MINKIPAITPEQMREVDVLMMDYYNISILQMMEHDARGLAEVAKILMKGSLVNKRVIVFSGSGGNGAGGLAAARHLHNAGAEVSCLIGGRIKQLNKEGQHHAGILEKIGIAVSQDLNSIKKDIMPDLVVDALLGYSASGDPRSPLDDYINRINDLQHKGAIVLANDIPSGLDVMSGEPHNPCVRADATMTVALPKTVLLKLAARDWIGQLYLCDIGVPPELYAKMNLPQDIVFNKEWIIKIV